MTWSLGFVLNSALLGVGLAMDAFSVSIANGLSHPNMSRGWILRIAGTFAFFQFIMPMLGWICVHRLVEAFSALQSAIPWIAFILLGWIGGKMVWEGLHSVESGEVEASMLTRSTLFIQGVATSIDALSTGFTIAEYGASMAFAASIIIAAVTLAICLVGVRIGKRFGLQLARRATILGGAILICIGLEILIRGLV